MNGNNLFLTTEDFAPPNWLRAFPHVQIISELFPTDFRPFDLVWIFTGLEQWQALTAKAANHCNVIVLTNMGAMEEFQSAMLCGAKGYMEALSNSQILQHAAQTVEIGGLWVPPGIISSLVKFTRRSINGFNHSHDPLQALSPREREVAEGILDGLSNPAIAEKLFITERTVKEHVSSIFSKLNISSRLQLPLLFKH